MTQGGMFGFPLLLIVFTVLVAWETGREFALMFASIYMQFRIWNQHRAPAEDGENNRKEAG